VEGGDKVAYFTVHNGVRSFVTALLLALAIYNRHRATIDPYLSQPVKDVMATLETLVAVLKALDLPGPN